jgi:hypothetical protein
MRLLIVGGSDAGISAALRARELDPTVEVTALLADRYANNLMNSRTSFLISARCSDDDRLAWLFSSLLCSPRFYVHAREEHSGPTARGRCLLDERAFLLAVSNAAGWMLLSLLGAGAIGSRRLHHLPC